MPSHGACWKPTHQITCKPMPIIRHYNHISFQIPDEQRHNQNPKPKRVNSNPISHHYYHHLQTGPKPIQNIRRQHNHHRYSANFLRHFRLYNGLRKILLPWQHDNNNNITDLVHFSQSQVDDTSWFYRHNFTNTDIYIQPIRTRAHLQCHADIDEQPPNTVFI